MSRTPNISFNVVAELSGDYINVMIILLLAIIAVLGPVVILRELGFSLNEMSAFLDHLDKSSSDEA